MTTREKKAVQTFKEGFNCAQSVLSSFEDKFSFHSDDLKAITAGFGGGMGKMQLTCGAVTGAFMVLSLYASEQKSDPSEAKELANELVREFNKRFTMLSESLSCRDILGVDMNTEEGLNEAKDKDLFGTVCVEAVEAATGITEAIISEKK